LTVDMVAISTLAILGGGIRSVVTVLYLMPLAGASLLLPTLATYFVCAIAVIVLLADAVLRGLGGDARESQIFQAGVYGAALFAVTGLLSLLSSRLASQERLARQRGRNLENQLEINRLVIAQMEQGVIVVDALTQVRANNRAARRLLGLPADTQFTGRQLSEFRSIRMLAQAFVNWVEGERERADWTAGETLPAGRPAATFTMAEQGVRARFVRPTASESAEFVIFLEDVRALDQKAQQLKLAAMGRLTASIAHEIRNPLAAISHAGQLLGEEARDPLQQRLSGIVRENTKRLNRLVEDVLRVARREPPQGDEFDLGEFVMGWLEEFLHDRAVAPGVVQVEVETGLGVKFERSHLRQVVFNLVDNALRYASGAAGSVRIRADRAAETAGAVRLWVFDDGPGVPVDVRAALFEPFYTTHARGTGLGLYLAREFCIANRADLQFEALRAADGTAREGFVVRFSRSAGVRTEEHGFLDTMPAQ
jgi:two-component system sensor histidine kinase PilS (NtrC family)